jgi:SAM-dependent methyltransferase
MFGKSKKSSQFEDSPAREISSRHSRGWSEILEYLKKNEAMRVLDFGATSPANINYLTSLGHSVYMANLVQDAARPEYLTVKKEAAPGAKAEFDEVQFTEDNFDFSRREFDVVLLWDTANFLPSSLVPLLFDRLNQILRPNGRLLAFFHGRTEGPGTEFTRYQISDSDLLTMLWSGSHPIQAIYQTRQIERFLRDYASTRFLLGKDNVREVIAIR